MIVTSIKIIPESTTINALFEYVSKNTYIKNDEEVEDLYYLDKGDIITLNHKDDGMVECEVRRVDVNKNKVYFVTLKDRKMGAVGFDKIYKIQNL